MFKKFAQENFVVFYGQPEKQLGLNQFVTKALWQKYCPC